MWLLHAHVNVNGQSQFTFPLEQKKSYTIGRRAEKDVQFLSKRVRMDEGRLDVGDWDPSKPKQPPEVIYHVAPKKGKDAIIPKYTIIRPQARTDRNDLESYEALEANEAQVNLAEHEGSGIRFDVGGEVPGWFTLEWQDICILYDDLKNEPEVKSETLYKYCIAYTYTFDPAQLPTITLTAILRPVQSLSYAVCYGLPIAKVLYLDILLDKLDGSWKKAVDSQDSFSLPDYATLLPDEYDAKLPHYRKSATSWVADPARKELFSGWSVLALNPNGKVVAAEKKWMTTMGADWTDFDLTSVSFESPSSMIEALQDWIKGVDAGHGRDRAIMAHFTSTKINMESAGVRFTEVVGGAAAALGVRLVNGRVCWQSVSRNSVESCVEELAKAEMTVQSATMPPDSAAPSATRRSTSPVKAAPATRTSPAKPVSTKATEVPVIPSTFPDEPTSTAVAPAPTGRRPLKRRAGKAAFDLFAVDDEPMSSADASPQESQEKDSGSMSMPPAAQPEDQETLAPTQATQMPTSTDPRTSRLKRRAGATVSAFDLFDSAPPESSAFPGTANGFESIKEESETPAEIRELYEATKRTSKLPPRKTRAASREASADVDMEAGPSTRRSTRAGSARRSEPPEAMVETGGDAQVGLASQGQGLDDVMEVDGEDEDFVQRTLKSVAAAKKLSRSQALLATSSQLAMPPPQILLTRRRGASPDDEETEPIEVKRAKTNGKSKQSASSKVASAISKAAQMDLDGEEEEEEEEVEEPTPSNQPTQDTAFLQAISKSRSKKAMDEMDKEFNNLRIPKPATKTAAKGKNSVFGPGASANGQDGAADANGDRGKWDGPDYSVLKDFNDEMRGNFIQVVKMDLYRKDGGRKESQEDVSGRPNFKKFRKKVVVRRDPVPLVLVGLHTEEAEMGEPYWPGLTAAPSSRRTQTQMQSRSATQGQAFDGGDEDTLPLLPVSRRTQMPRSTILEEDEEEDELGPTPLPATGRRRGAGASQFGLGSAGNSQASTQLPLSGRGINAGGRRTRGTSVMSEESNVSGSTRTSRATATKTAAPARATARKRPQPLLLEDSEEEGVDFTPSAAGSARTKGSNTTSRAAAPANTTGGRRALPTPTTAGTASTRLFDDDDDLDPPPSAISSTRRPGARSTGLGMPSASMQASGMGSMAQQSRTARAKQSAAGAGTGSTGQVRRLVDDDDDDDVIPIAAAKKRRLG